MKMFNMQGGQWKHLGAINLKDATAFKRIQPSIKEAAWKDLEMPVALILKSGRAATLSVLAAIPQFYNPNGYVEILNSSGQFMRSYSYTELFTGVSRLATELDGTIVFKGDFRFHDGVNTTLFPTNSVITEIVYIDPVNWVAIYPGVKSSVLVSVPNTLNKNITSLAHAFNSCYNFNQALPWDTGHVRLMNSAFLQCQAFNQTLDFDTRQVSNMGSMLSACIALNSPLNFDTSNVQTMTSMLSSCLNFNQDISNWNVDKVTAFSGFRSGSGLSDAHTPLKFR